MLKIHSDKGQEDWEIYAWCVRDLIAKIGKLKKSKYESIQNKYQIEYLY